MLDHRGGWVRLRVAARFGVLAIACSIASIAAAQSGDPGVEVTIEDEEARSLFDAGRIALSQGRFDEALDRFERAYELSPRVEMLYNVGLAADRAGHIVRAIEAFEAYLARTPDPDQRAQIEARVRVLRTLRTDEPVSEGDSDAEAVADPEPMPTAEPSSFPIAATVLGGLTLAVGVTAIALYAHASIAYDELSDTCSPRCADDEVDPLRQEVLAAQIMGPIAGALVVGAVVALVLELGSAAEASQSELRFYGTGVDGRF
ncbi:MAG: tol-pal system YbgF family protein [Sandaracinaceae bacterium]